MGSKRKEWAIKLSAFFATNCLGTIVDTVVLFLFSTYVFPEVAGSLAPSAADIGQDLMAADTLTDIAEKARHLTLSDNFYHVIVSPFISFECAVLVNFICSYYVVWRGRVSKHSKKSFWGHYAAYNASCTVVFLFKMIVLYAIWYASNGWNVVICNLLALCVSGIINFLMGEKVIFRKKRVLLPEEQLQDAGTE